MRLATITTLTVLGGCFVCAPALAGWTFCVAESAVGGKDIWITAVFAANRERTRLESDFRAQLRAHGAPQTVVQCPAPKDDKTEMVNQQFTAVEFHRKLGDALHEAAAP